jgi:hypothetical protein
MQRTIASKETKQDLLAAYYVSIISEVKVMQLRHQFIQQIKTGSDLLLDTLQKLGYGL